MLRTACAFFVDDCANNQKQVGIFAFNKVKHGLLLVPSAKRYFPGSIDAPALIHESDPADAKNKSHPVSVHAIPCHDEQIAHRLRALHFVQIDTRILALLSAIKRWPDRVKARGFSTALDVLDRPNVRDLQQIMLEITAKGKQASS